jgi:hypothetical protein
VALNPLRAHIIDEWCWGSHAVVTEQDAAPHWLDAD